MTSIPLEIYVLVGCGLLFGVLAFVASCVQDVRHQRFEEETLGYLVDLAEQGMKETDIAEELHRRIVRLEESHESVAARLQAVNGIFSALIEAGIAEPVREEGNNQRTVRKRVSSHAGRKSRTARK